MASGASNALEAAWLDSATLGLERDLYLYLFRTSTPGAGGGAIMDDDGTRGSTLHIVTGGGFAPLTIAAADWDPAVLGNPTKKQFAAAVTKQWTANATDFGELCWWALSTVSGATINSNATWDSNKAAMAFHGPITNSSGTAITVPILVGESFQFDTANPLLVQVGDVGDTFA